MRKIAMIVVIFADLCHCQTITTGDLVGFWQAGDSVVSDMYKESYQFFDGGKFVFHTNQYDGLERVKEIRGNYSLRGDSLFLTVNSTVELVGGVVRQSEITTLSGQWEIDDYKVEERKQDNSVGIQRIILGRRVHEARACLLLNKRPYYKIFSDPYEAQFDYNQ